MNKDQEEDNKGHLTGQSTHHLVEYDDHLIHCEALSSFRELCEAAAREGFEIKATSIFRSHERQLAIWNEKARGQRPLLDSRGNPLNYDSLSPGEVLETILRWSAIPGASRHHWGTEADVYDHSALPPGTAVELTPQEVAGIFALMHTWLDDNLSRFDFFRPYQKDQGGVAPEAWHLSYRPVSERYFKEYDFACFERAISHPDLELRELLWERREDIFERFVRNISH